MEAAQGGRRTSVQAVCVRVRSEALPRGAPRRRVRVRVRAHALLAGAKPVVVLVPAAYAAAGAARAGAYVEGREDVTGDVELVGGVWGEEGLLGAEVEEREGGAGGRGYGGGAVLARGACAGGGAAGEPRAAGLLHPGGVACGVFAQPEDEVAVGQGGEGGGVSARGRGRRGRRTDSLRPARRRGATPQSP